MTVGCTSELEGLKQIGAIVRGAIAECGKSARAGMRTRDVDAIAAESNVPYSDDVLHEGLVITIEPFLTTGKGSIKQDRDGWTLRTTDGGLVAQYEHTMVITRGAPIVVT